MDSILSINSLKKVGLYSLIVASLTSASFVEAKTDITFWHAMSGQLGEEVNGLVQQFNASQNDFEVSAVYKGNYDETITAGIAAIRTGESPEILQVYEVGTATMISSNAIVPVYEVFEKANLPFDESLYVDTVRSYYTDSQSGRMLSMPFNSSTPVLYYNKDAYKKAGLDPKTPPKTWQEVETHAKKLLESGMSCGYTFSNAPWVHLENFSAWHGLPFATLNNGYDGLSAELQVNTANHINFLNFLNQMNKDKTLQYFGRRDEGMEKFYNGDCGIFTGSSGSRGSIEANAKFELGMGFLPYLEGISSAPQNTMIGGASLWVMKDKSEDTYKGIAAFLSYLALPENAARWHQNTGYVPVTLAGYELTKQQGFYDKNPGANVAIEQLLFKEPLPHTRGLRLGNMTQIRQIADEEFEAVLTGQKSPESALNDINTRANQQLRRFEKSNQ
ncbi:sn-glycerol-3-phosphate ABC transporter substrate-binding protein UgpB [Thorsellia kenyensis]|uniref:sn-glycerol-3-phosphate-binding periplasmic protein UgpB n=1 Tax=Thorsellia kenyensis TaxID=1549888 RepID=A0ABV6C8C7_9GAMM